MNGHREASAQTVAEDLKHVFAERLRSVVVYGPEDATRDDATPCLVLVSTLTGDDLDACATLATGWARRGIATPLLLPETELQRSLDSFPLEFAEILQSYQCVHGADPLAGVAVEREDIRRACERQTRSHLLHLREGYVEAHGDPHAIARLLQRSSPAFAALLRNVARLLGLRAPTPIELAMQGAHAMGLADEPVHQVLALSTDRMVPADSARLFPPYLAVVEDLVRAIDTWQP